ncbi:serine hydroxymethyltransferase [Microgenomates group bacterium RIFCSPLOWO2_01_FULL_47_10]|nr:MAG: serine hydroxymethyltransferase [Microgenomates group bacterium RIFCSPLOWO2_01_FULL_47_10]
MDSLETVDKKIKTLIEQEKERQATTLMMIPSENYASRAVEEAVGSCLENKYAEGYPTKRYYQGQTFVDQVELLAIERAKKLFDVAEVNVQPYSGSPANSAVYFALLKPKDKIMGLKLSSGGHLTHGHPNVTFSGRYFTSVQYEVKKDGYIDYEYLKKLVKKEKPAMIVAGTTAYPRTLDFHRFAEIADSVGAYLLADISHIAGLVVSGTHPSPAPFADIIMTTTHKTLRGPRGAMIMVTHKGLKKDRELAIKINKAIFPGLQGGPHINTIAGIAVCLKEAGTKKFVKYGHQVVKNAKVLAQTLMDNGMKLVTKGTDNHLIVIDVSPLNITGKEAAIDLEKAGMVLNYNTVPFDTNPPANPSGIRLGTPAMTSRGLKEPQMRFVGRLLSQVLKKEVTVDTARKDIGLLCSRFPIPEMY